MRAVDQNGLEFDVFQCGRDCMRDIYWNVYRLKQRDGEVEQYIGVEKTDVIIVERCDCEGSRDPAPGAGVFNGEDIERCDECKRFEDDQDACSAYAAGLNRAIGHEHFVPYLQGQGRQYLALASAADETLDEEQIDAELKQLGVTVTSVPYLPPIRRSGS